MFKFMLESIIGFLVFGACFAAVAVPFLGMMKFLNLI